MATSLTFASMSWWADVILSESSFIGEVLSVEPPFEGRNNECTRQESSCSPTRLYILHESGLEVWKNLWSSYLEMSDHWTKADQPPRWCPSMLFVHPCGDDTDAIRPNDWACFKWPTILKYRYCFGRNKPVCISCIHSQMAPRRVPQ